MEKRKEAKPSQAKPSQIKRVLDFYKITHTLKNTIRSGWRVWEMDAKRLESVAEHVYGTQMLAIAINSEFNMKLDIAKVCLMLAIHELGECVIGDLPSVGRGMTREEKHKLEMQAVEKILEPISNSKFIKDMYVEFEEMKTPEARFAYFMDKLDCPLQSKFYEEMGASDLFKERKGEFKELCDKTIADGKMRLFDMWYAYDVKHFFSDDDAELYRNIMKYILDNDVFVGLLRS